MFKRIDIINSLAPERPLTEEILVYLRHDVGIRVKASLPAEEAGKE